MKTILKTNSFIFFILLFGSIITAPKANAQVYGNEWINYSRQYFKVKISKEGIYRIPYNTLVTAGVPLGSFDPRSFQIYTRGIEQPIFVRNESSGVFSTDDYIEFYADKNNGWFDSTLYNAAGTQANPNYSLFNDTAVYFLTWNSSVNNKRFTIENDTNFSAYTPMPYFWGVSHVNYVQEYLYGMTNNLGSTDAEYVSCEGWFDPPFTYPQSKTKTISTPQFYASGPQATAQFVVVGASSATHQLRIEMPAHIIDTTFIGYKIARFNRQIPANMLGLNGNQFKFSALNQNTDRNAIAFIRIRYAHIFNLNNASTYKMFIPQATQSKGLLSITNFNAAANDSVFLYDLTGLKRITVLKSGIYHKALIPNTGSEKTCFITAGSQISNITSLIPVNTDVNSYARFTNYNSAPHNASNYLIITHKKLMDEALNYKDYRTLSGFTVLLADIDELYDQFAYGIIKHPLSIRNFARYAMNKFVVQPEYLFLIGKSLNASDYRKNSSSANDYSNTLVPTFGVPPSDILFTSRLLDSLYQPAIPTGRLTAENNNHVSLYLNKVIEYEQKQQQAQHTPELWMKNVLHFGGGGNINEQQLIKQYLKQWENIIEDTMYGGYVQTFLKTSTAPIQINQSDSLKNIINNGVSLMTFYGHASGAGFDQSTDNPSEYNNQGKYPFIFANSCYAGDIFTNSLSTSQAFVLIPNKGAIGFLASTAPSPLNPLKQYGDWFYKHNSSINYGKSVGKCIQQTIKSIQNVAMSNPFVKEVCLVTVLHGDPAIKLNYFEKPDYEVNASSVFYTPAFISSELDSFNVNVISTNKGKAVPGHFIIELVRTLPDGTTTETYLKQITATAYKDTISFKLPVNLISGVGINTFKVTLDLYNEIDEITKLNNTITVNLFIKSNDIIPVLPSKYAVVPTPNVTLKASTGYPFSAQKNYTFQIDTTDYFNSPFLRTYNITHSGGVVNCPLDFTLTDSTVYYWRVALNIPEPIWRESSFQYINNKTGWGQSHFFQYKDNTYEYVSFNRPNRNFVFVNNINVLTVQTGIYPHLRWDYHWYKINGADQDVWTCLFDYGNGMKFAVFNPVSGKPWMSYKVNPPIEIGPYGNTHCKIYPVPAFDFSTHNNEWRKKILDFIDSIPNGYHVLAYNHKNHYAEQYNDSLKEAFESFGSANIRTLVNNTPYIIYGTKGEPIGSANEVIGATQYSTINLTDSIITAWNEGYIKSELIGPASKWVSIHWRFNSADNLLTDSVRLSVLGVKLDGQEDTLMSNITPDSPDIYYVNTVINAQEYPYLYLVAFMRDDSLHTPAQMKRWHVLYDGVPETCLNPSKHFHFHKDTLQQGENLVFSCAIENIGQFDMDSLLVKYWIIDKNGNYIPINYPRQRPHPVNDIFIDTVRFNTKDISGMNSFWVEVNPDYDQIEQHTFNNIGEIPFYVFTDKTNPMLDVTFDGVHILDGDIVSAKPLIQVVLRDENKFIALEDTALFRMYLKKPGMLEAERVYFKVNGADNIIFYKATLPENVCRLEHRPGHLPDGIYELSVQAKDASQNISGFYNYTISFKVVNKSTITEVLNYPNPFSTSTRFVFTLTGSELPSYMKIQIMTISGKIVKEIDMAELGNIHIGRNITQYAWDGTDMYGDRLANGVYLYRVIAKMGDKSIELFETQASKYFTQEFGKMYLIR